MSWTVTINVWVWFVATIVLSLVVQVIEDYWLKWWHKKPHLPMTQDVILNALVCAARSNMRVISYNNEVLADWMQRTIHPQVGDLVLEISNPKALAIDRIGRLISHKEEDPIQLKKDYDEAAWGRPYPPYLEDTYRIRTVDGREVKWTNAEFMRIPEREFYSLKG